MWGTTVCEHCGVCIPYAHRDAHKCDNDGMVEYEAKKFHNELDMLESQMSYGKWETKHTAYYRWLSQHKR